jgi:hypothetical protein
MNRLLCFASAAALSLTAYPSIAEDHWATNALMNLNNYIDAIKFSDACFRQSNGRRALQPLLLEIEAARTLAAKRYPRLAVSPEASDTDYVCVRGTPGHVDRREIQRQVRRLIRELETAVQK